MTKKESRSIWKKPPHFKLEKDDVWPLFDDKDKKITEGRIVASSGEKCPIWKDKVPYKSVTAVCTKDELNEVLYWLSYVHGGEHSKMCPLPDNKIAIRSDYQAW